MYKFLISSAVILGLLILVVPTTAADQVYPGQEDPTGAVIGDIKASYGGTGEPRPIAHDGSGADNRNPMPWYWHPDEDYANVAGVRFTIHYDSYEAAILGINPTGGTANGPFNGHYNFDPPPVSPPSQGGNSVHVQGTIWVDHPLANESGVLLPASEPVQLFSLSYLPRHTSQVSNTLYNTDVDIKVTNLTPIYHVGQDGLTGSFWQYNPDLNTLTHVASVPGIWLPNSAEYVPGPIMSESAPQIQHVQNSVHIPSSVVAHAAQSSVTLPTAAGYHIYHWTTRDPMQAPDSEIWIPLSAEVHLQGSLVLTGQYIQPSSFVVGAPIGQLGNEAKFFGLGVDHVAEPVSLTLLSLGGIAILVQAGIRRRRQAATVAN